MNTPPHLSVDQSLTQTTPTPRRRSAGLHTLKPRTPGKFSHSQVQSEPWHQKPLRLHLQRLVHIPTHLYTCSQVQTHTHSHASAATHSFWAHTNPPWGVWNQAHTQTLPTQMHAHQCLHARKCTLASSDPPNVHTRVHTSHTYLHVRTHPTYSPSAHTLAPYPHLQSFPLVPIARGGHTLTPRTCTPSPPARIFTHTHTHTRIPSAPGTPGHLLDP